MRNQEECFRYYENLCHKAFTKNARKPMSCARCPYRREDFRYRTCVFTRCPFGKAENVFRKRPLKREKVTGNGVKKMHV